MHTLSSEGNSVNEDVKNQSLWDKVKAIVKEVKEQYFEYKDEMSTKYVQENQKLISTWRDQGCHHLGVKWVTKPIVISSTCEEENIKLKKKIYYNSVDYKNDKPQVVAVLRPLEIPLLKRIPRYCMWVPVHINIKCDDDPVLRFLPYFGDDDHECVDFDMYDATIVEDDERENEMKAYLFYKVIKCFNVNLAKLKYTYDTICSAIADTGNYVEELDRYNNEHLLELWTGAVEGRIWELLFILTEYLQRPLMKMLTRVFELAFEELEENHSLPHLNGNMDIPTSITTEKQCIESFLTLFCKRCFKYDCHMHGSSLNNVTNRHLVETHEVVDPCGDQCFLNVKDALPEEWSSVELALMHQGQKIFSSHYCHISVLVGTKSCHQVALKCQSNNIILEQEEEEESTGEIVVQRKQKRRKKLTSKGTLAKGKDVVAEYVPCYHPGQKCDPSVCLCVQNGLYCEKYCHCEMFCKHRFPGCRCKHKCDSRQCPCFSAQRECDPDLCFSCEGSDISSFKCKNVSIQRGLAKTILIGPSEVAGFGVFTKSFIKKNEFVAEYCGEMISQVEADRRGKYYDKHGLSFLFNLNEDYVVDATRKGSHIRFANHSARPNCYAKITRVNGDCRIGIYALKDLEPGEELFFDYRYGAENLKFVPIERKLRRN